MKKHFFPGQCLLFSRGWTSFPNFSGFVAWSYHSQINLKGNKKIPNKNKPPKKETTKYPKNKPPTRNQRGATQPLRGSWSQPPRGPARGQAALRASERASGNGRKSELDTSKTQGAPKNQAVYILDKSRGLGFPSKSSLPETHGVQRDSEISAGRTQVSASGKTARAHTVQDYPSHTILRRSVGLVS